MDKGIHKEPCCCNCRNQVELFKHPGNMVYRGSILESTGMYACTSPLNYEDEQYRGILFEEKHGLCEMHGSRKSVEQQAPSIEVHEYVDQNRPANYNFLNNPCRDKVDMDLKEQFHKDHPCEGCNQVPTVACLSKRMRTGNC